MSATYDAEFNGRKCLQEMEDACRFRAPGAMREAIKNAAHFLLLARMDLADGQHETDIIVAVQSRLRTLKYAAS